MFKVHLFKDGLFYASFPDLDPPTKISVRSCENANSVLFQSPTN
jgi:hypothetical protein